MGDLSPLRPVDDQRVSAAHSVGSQKRGDAEWPLLGLGINHRMCQWKTREFRVAPSQLASSTCAHPSADVRVCVIRRRRSAVKRCFYKRNRPNMEIIAGLQPAPEKRMGSRTISLPRCLLCIRSSQRLSSLGRASLIVSFPHCPSMRTLSPPLHSLARQLEHRNPERPMDEIHKKRKLQKANGMKRPKGQKF